MPLTGRDKQRALESAWRNRKDRVEWFSPLQLWRTAMKVRNSQTITSHADHREIQAGFADIYDASHKPSFHDFSNRGTPFIFDFAADTGDGWDATVAVGDLLFRDSITAGGETLPRASVVVFGGDLVYPTAGRHDYKCRFIGPFLTAADRHHLPYAQPEDPHGEKSPRVFAIPGNHDWYDGLTAFWSLFCRSRLGAKGLFEKERWVGPWVAAQQRSYFALRLPGNWWIWGIDVQLWEWVDTPQRYYFEDLADRMKKEFPGAKLLICTAEPSWVFGQSDNPQQFRALSYMANRALERGIEVRAVLSGDLHHYSRYRGELTAGDQKSKQECQFVTSGGGGAFSAPTHCLPADLNVEINDDGYWPLHYARLDGGLARSYPEPSVTKSAALQLPFLLAWRNPTLFLWLAGLWAVMPLWQWHGFPLLAAIPLAGFTLFARLGKRVFNESIDLIWDRQGIAKLVAQLGWIPMGLVHGVIQVAACHHLVVDWTGEPTGVWRHFEIGIAGALLCTFLMGLYLGVCSRFFDLHHNEAFSALRLTDWKNFLRVRIDASGAAMMHVIGLDKVPKDTNTGRQNVSPSLIESVPL